MNTEAPSPGDEPPEPDDDPGLHGPEPAPGVSVEVNDAQSFLAVDPDAVARVVRVALDAEGVADASVSVALVDDAAIRAVNRRHLGHDWPTDVISFPLSDPGDDALSGELVVSAETALATARGAGVPAWDELALYLVHGLLHLCGHDDHGAEARGAMRRREGEVLARLGLSNTFPAAAVADGPAGERERSRWTV